MDFAFSLISNYAFDLPIPEVSERCLAALGHSRLAAGLCSTNTLLGRPRFVLFSEIRDFA